MAKVTLNRHDMEMMKNQPYMDTVGPDGKTVRIDTYNLVFETMLRKFKKKVQAEGILEECRKREYFVKKSIKRKLKREAHAKLMRKMNKNKIKYLKNHPDNH